MKRMFHAGLILAALLLMAAGNPGDPNSKLAQLRQAQQQELDGLVQTYGQKAREVAGRPDGTIDENSPAYQAVLSEYAQKKQEIQQKYVAQDTRGREIDLIKDWSQGKVVSTGSSPKDVRADADLTAKTDAAASEVEQRWRDRGDKVKVYPHKIVNESTDTVIWLPSTPAREAEKRKDPDAFLGGSEHPVVKNPVGEVENHDMKYGKAVQDGDLKTQGKSVSKAAGVAGTSDETVETANRLRNYEDEFQTGIVPLGATPEQRQEKLTEFTQKTDQSMAKSKQIAQIQQTLIQDTRKSLADHAEQQGDTAAANKLRNNADTVDSVNKATTERNQGMKQAGYPDYKGDDDGEGAAKTATTPTTKTATTGGGGDDGGTAGAQTGSAGAQTSTKVSGGAFTQTDGKTTTSGANKTTVTTVKNPDGTGSTRTENEGTTTTSTKGITSSSDSTKASGTRTATQTGTDGASSTRTAGVDKETTSTKGVIASTDSTKTTTTRGTSSTGTDGATTSRTRTGEKTETQTDVGGLGTIKTTGSSSTDAQTTGTDGQTTTKTATKSESSTDLGGLTTVKTTSSGSSSSTESKGDGRTTTRTSSSSTESTQIGGVTVNKSGAVEGGIEIKKTPADGEEPAKPKEPGKVDVVIAKGDLFEGVDKNEGRKETGPIMTTSDDGSGAAIGGAKVEVGQRAASGNYQVSSDGQTLKATATVQGEANVVKGEAKGSARQEIAPGTAVQVDGRVTGTLGAEGGGQVAGEVGPDGVKVKAGVNVFIGAKLEGEIGGTLDAKDSLGLSLTAKGKGAILAGAGGEAGGSLEVGWTKVAVNGKLAGALGLGLKGEGQVEIDATKLIFGVDPVRDEQRVKASEMTTAAYKELIRQGYAGGPEMLNKIYSMANLAAANPDIVGKMDPAELTRQLVEAIPGKEKSADSKQKDKEAADKKAADLADKKAKEAADKEAAQKAADEKEAEEIEKDFEEAGEDLDDIFDGAEGGMDDLTDGVITDIDDATKIRNEAGEEVSSDGYQNGDMIIGQNGDEFVMKGGEWVPTGENYGEVDPETLAGWNEELGEMGEGADDDGAGVGDVLTDGEEMGDGDGDDGDGDDGEAGDGDVLTDGEEMGDGDGDDGDGDEGEAGDGDVLTDGEEMGDGDGDDGDADDGDGDDLADNEPELGGDGGDGDEDGNAVGDFTDDRDENNEDRVDNGFGGMDANDDVADATTSGDGADDDAQNTINQGGASAGRTRHNSATQVASADRQNSWRTKLGNGIADGVEQGANSFGTAVGQGTADHTVKGGRGGTHVNGDADDDGDDGDDGDKGGTDVSSGGSTGGGGKGGGGTKGGGGKNVGGSKGGGTKGSGGGGGGGGKGNKITVSSSGDASDSSSGGYAAGPQDKVINIGGKLAGKKVTGCKVRVTYDAYGIPDTFKVVYEGQVLASSGSVSYGGTLSAKGTGTSPRVIIRVISSDDQGTSWEWSATATFYTEDADAGTGGGAGTGGNKGKTTRKPMIIAK